MNRPRIVQIVQHLRPGGIETLALELLRLMDDELEHHIISLEGEGFDEIAHWKRLSVCKDRLHFLAKPPGLQWNVGRKLAGLLTQLTPLAVHTHHIGPLLYGGIAARISRIPARVHTEHDAWHLENPKRRRLARTALAFASPVLIADGGLVARKVEAALGCGPVPVIANGIDTSLFTPGNRARARAHLGLPLEPRIIGCAARLEDVKGVDILLRAAVQLPSDTHIALAGAGRRESFLKQLTHSLGLAGRVHFLGALTDMPNFYRALNVFCLPSRAEGIPLAPLEAQACGIPCLLSDVGGCSEVLCRTTGRLFTAEDPSALAQVARALPDNHPLLSPRAFVLMHGCGRKMAQSYKDLYLQGGRQ